MAKINLRTLKGQGRLKGQTCPPNRHKPGNNLRTTEGQKRKPGKPCQPTIDEYNERRAVHVPKTPEEPKPSKDKLLTKVKKFIKGKYKMKTYKGTLVDSSDNFIARDNGTYENFIYTMGEFVAHPSNKHVFTEQEINDLDDYPNKTKEFDNIIKKAGYYLLYNVFDGDSYTQLINITDKQYKHFDDIWIKKGTSQKDINKFLGVESKPEPKKKGSAHTDKEGRKRLDKLKKANERAGIYLLLLSKKHDKPKQFLEQIGFNTDVGRIKNGLSKAFVKNIQDQVNASLEGKKTLTKREHETHPLNILIKTVAALK